MDPQASGGVYASLVLVDPSEEETGGSSPRQRRAAFGRPRRSDQLPPPPAGVQTGDVPPALLPEPVPVSALVKVGEVCGQEIYARREIVEAAARIRLNSQREGTSWPSDALRATILALRMASPKPTYREIAEMLNMSERHVLRTMKRGTKDGVAEREIARLDREGMPMAVENVLDGLQDGDKDYTLEYLKGRGVFRQKHETVVDPNAAAPFTGLVVQFVHDGNAPPQREAKILANPNRALATRVIEAAPESASDVSRAPRDLTVGEG